MKVKQRAGVFVVTDESPFIGIDRDAFILSMLNPHSRERWRDRLSKKLSHQGEVRLTNLERMVLLELLKQKKRGRGRPVDENKHFRDYAIDGYIEDLEYRGEPTKAAVDKAVDHFGIKRATAYAARVKRRRHSK